MHHKNDKFPINQILISQQINHLLSTQGDSSVLHWASLLCMIFESLACAYDRMHIHNVRDSPQAKLNSEINACFLLNERVW